MASPQKTGLDANAPSATPTEQRDLVYRIGAVLKRARAAGLDVSDLVAALERRVEALERRVRGT